MGIKEAGITALRPFLGMDRDGGRRILDQYPLEAFGRGHHLGHDSGLIFLGNGKADLQDWVCFHIGGNGIRTPAKRRGKNHDATE